MGDSESKHTERSTLLSYACVFLLVAGIRILFAAFTRLTYEDALITMRYAENLAAGHGFVYNIGERVLGTTTPLFTLLLALGVNLGLGAILTAKALGILADGVSGILIYALVHRWGRGTRAAWYAVVLFGIWGVVVRVAVSGMETPLVVLLMLASLYALLLQRPWLAGILAGLLLWTRMDALCWLGVLFVWYCISQRRIAWQPIVTCLAVLAPWLVFGTLYFGSPLPNSIAAKLVAYEDNAGFTVARTAADMFGAFLGNRPSEIILRGLPLILYLAGISIVIRRHPRLTVLAIFPVIYLAAMLCMRVYMFDWYYVPAMVPYLVVAGIGADTLNVRLDRDKGGLLMRYAGPVVVLMACGLYLAHHARGMKAFQQAEEMHFKQPGLWLAYNTTPDAKVLLEPIGYIGYYSGRYILDEIGLVSPQVVEYRRQHSDEFRNVPAFALLTRHFQPE